MTTEGPEKTTEERILEGVRLIYQAVEQLTGRFDRLSGAVDDQRQIIVDLITALPKPVRYCPPMVGEQGTVWCGGGYTLMRSKLGKDNPKHPEWTHPLLAENFHVITLPTGGQQEVRWHNVYDSRSLTEPPDGVVREWPPQEGEQGDQPDHIEPDDLPF